MLKSRRVWLGFFVTAVFLAFFAYRVDLHEMARVLAGGNYLFLVPGMACYFLALWFRTVRWKLILLPLQDLASAHLWPVMVIGYAANNVLPVRLGELVRAYFLGERSGVSKSAALGTIVVERVFDGLALLLLAAMVAPFFSLVGLFQELGEVTHVPWLVLTLGLSLPFFTLSALFIAIALMPRVAERVLDKGLRFLPYRMRLKVRGVVLSFLAGVSALRNPRLLAAILLFSIPVWLAEAAMYFVIGFGFGMDAFFANWGLMAAAMVIATATSNLGTAIPSSGGGVGPFEFFNKETLHILGVSAPVASAFTITLHLALLAPVTLLGLVYLWTQHLSLLRVARASQEKMAAVGEVAQPQLEEGGPL